MPDTAVGATNVATQDLTPEGVRRGGLGEPEEWASIGVGDLENAVPVLEFERQEPGVLRQNAAFERD